MKLILKLTLMLSMLLPLSSHAERSVEFGSYIVHYNAFKADAIPAEVARIHNIVRSNRRGLVNVTVLKKEADGSTHPVQARVWGTIRNLNNQLNNLVFFPVQEQNTIYYLDQFRISGHETLSFELFVEPKDAPNGLRGDIKFTQDFFTN